MFDFEIIINFPMKEIFKWNLIFFITHSYNLYIFKIFTYECIFLKLLLTFKIYLLCNYVNI